MNPCLVPCSFFSPKSEAGIHSRLSEIYRIRMEEAERDGPQRLQPVAENRSSAIRAERARLVQSGASGTPVSFVREPIQQFIVLIKNLNPC